MTKHAHLISDMLEPSAEAALRDALERFYRSDKISDIWPGAVKGPRGRRLPLRDVEIVVLPLDRIGAPAGASGSQSLCSLLCPSPGGDEGWHRPNPSL